MTQRSFWDRVDKSGDCWLWLLALNPNGYGAYRGTTAHRWALQDAGVKIPEGWHVDHLCRVRHCVNPAHLEAVTPAENRRREVRIQKTECRNGHDLDGNVYEHTYPSGTKYRACLTCRRKASREAYHRRKART